MQADDKELIECPFCGKKEEWWLFNCPDCIGTCDDDSTHWTDNFSILDEIDPSSIEEFDSSNLFAGLDPCWGALLDYGFALDYNWLGELNHPLVECISYSNPEAHLGSWNYWYLVAKDNQKLFLDEVREVKRRLDEVGGARSRGYP